MKRSFNHNVVQIVSIIKVTDRHAGDWSFYPEKVKKRWLLKDKIIPAHYENRYYLYKTFTKEEVLEKENGFCFINEAGDVIRFPYISIRTTDGKEYEYSFSSEEKLDEFIKDKVIQNNINLLTY